MLTANDLKTIVTESRGPCVSIYLPTHEAGRDVREDPIRFKNLLNVCRQQLASHPWPGQTASLLTPGVDCLEDFAFWKTQKQGLAFFLTPSGSRHVRLPYPPAERAVVGRHPLILPLLPLTGRSDPFYVLVLNQKNIQLFRGDPERLCEVPIPEVPKSLDTLLQYDQAQEHLQLHTAPAGKTLGSDAQFHGQGNIADDRRRKQHIERFLNAVAKAVDRQLQGEAAPLILAGVDYEQAMYRAASDYRYLTDQTLPSEGQRLKPDSLHQQALAIATAYFDRRRQAHVAAYHDQTAAATTTADIREIVPAAHAGRVDRLLIDCDQSLPGTFDPASETVTLNRTEAADDLLNLAAVYAIDTDAAVYPVRGEDLGHPAAAILRYPRTGS